MLDVLGKILGILLILFVVLGVLGVLALAVGTRAGRRKLLQLVVVLLVVTFFSFSLLHLTPGDPARTQKPFASEEQLKPIREEIGLNELVSFTVPANQRSVRVMEKLGMTHDPADDFDHPNLPAGHPLRRHLLYRLSRQQWSQARTRAS